MRPEDLRDLIRRQPFRPFRITLTDGRMYEVRHPEMLMIGRSSAVLGLPRPEDVEPVADRFVMLSLLQIMQAEPLEPTAA